jgi:hypothetical protein
MIVDTFRCGRPVFLSFAAEEKLTHNKKKGVEDFTGGAVGRLINRKYLKGKILLLRKKCYLGNMFVSNHVRWVPLSPQHGGSSGCGWKGRPPALEVSCEYID